MKPRPVQLILALLLCGPALLVVPASVALAQPEAAVVVTPAETARERIIIRAVGQSRALRSTTLEPDASGRVREVLIEPDTLVSEGTPLLRLDDRAERIALGLAEIRLADARRLLERYTRADGTGAFAPTTVDEARRDVELAELELAQAQVALADRTLRAPFAGYTGLTDVEAGARVTEDTAVTTLDDRRRLLVRFRVAERHFGRIGLGDEVSVRAWSDDPAIRTATITRIDSRIDTTSGTFRMEASLANADDVLRPGMRFAVSIETEGPAHWRIPETALLWGDDGAYAWRISAGKAERVDLQLVSRERGHVLVDGPLASGDDIVSEGVQRMRPGRTVRILNASALDDYPALDARRARQSDS